jgi:hypothetical protein
MKGFTCQNNANCGKFKKTKEDCNYSEPRKDTNWHDYCGIVEASMQQNMNVQTISNAEAQRTQRETTFSFP